MAQWVTVRYQDGEAAVQVMTEQTFGRRGRSAVASLVVSADDERVAAIRSACEALLKHYGDDAALEAEIAAGRALAVAADRGEPV